MKANDLLTENTNLHLTHLEDLALFQGKTGAIKAISFLKNLAELAKSSSAKKFNVTIKWDGSPAIFCGTDPSDGKFFVGTKAVFNKGAKLNKSIEDIDNNHPDVVQKGETKDKSGLRQKLRVAFTELSKLGIDDVLQGDLLFTKNDLKSISYKGDPYIAFKPNTLTYAVPSESKIAKELQQAEIGIVFHTSYSGNSLEDMSASFKVDLSKLNKVSSVWYDDAYIKDFTGIVNLTTGEYQAVQKAIQDAESYIGQAGNIFDWLEASEFGKDFKQLVHANHNNMVRAGAITQDPDTFFINFAKDYENRIEKAISNLKTGREGPAGQRKLAGLEQWNKTYFANKDNIKAWYSAWLKLTAIKNTLYQKLKNIRAIDAFELKGDEYVVSDQEGFVAVDHVGDAVKIIDRLDFSKKNFAKESIEYSIINDLTESRAFRSRQDLGKFTAPEIGELVYAYIIALAIMHNEYKYKKMAQDYSSRTLSYNNFDFFRTNGTDLYLLIHSILGKGSIIQFDKDSSSDKYVERLQSNVLSIKNILNLIGKSNLSNLGTELMRIERELKVNNSTLKKSRRMVGDYSKLKQKERYTLLINVEQYIRKVLPKSELYGILQSMNKERQLANRITTQKSLPKNVAVGAR
jgi:uncharacterized protein YeeX (DUF496 family)